MADTRAQLDAEEWIRKEWMPVEFGRIFYPERFRLSTGGVFDFDAVSEDKSIIALISTSGASTASGKNGVGKLFKIRSDVLFLILAEADRKLIILTEKDMLDRCLQERNSGMLPHNIEFHLAEIPEELKARLKKARAKASSEVSPSQQSHNHDQQKEEV